MFKLNMHTIHMIKFINILYKNVKQSITGKGREQAPAAWHGAHTPDEGTSHYLASSNNLARVRNKTMSSTLESLVCHFP